MKKYLVCLLLFGFAVNFAEGCDTIMSQRYYYEVVSVNRKWMDCYVASYMYDDVCFKKDTIFIKRSYFNEYFIFEKEEENVFFKQGDELYLIRPDGARLFLSIANRDAVVYFHDPCLEVTNNIYGRIHWYLGADTIMQEGGSEKQIRHKFLVKVGFPLMVDDEIPLKKSFYLERSRRIEYRYYDEHFMLLSTEYAGNYGIRYFEIRRVRP